MNVQIQIRISSRIGKVPVTTAYDAGIRIQINAPSQVPKKTRIHRVRAVDANNNKIMIGDYNVKTNYIFTVVFEGIQQLKIKISRQKDTGTPFTPRRVIKKLVPVLGAGKEDPSQIRNAITVIQPKVRKEYNIAIKVSNCFNFL